jgi:imidazolonepropionase-like amidohydrolase
MQLARTKSDGVETHALRSHKDRVAMGSSKSLIASGLCVVLASCATQPDKPAASAPSAPQKLAYPSTYKPASAPPIVIRNATILTGTGERLNGADLVIADGRIQSLGSNAAPPANARVIDANGKWVTPGIIDVHSHLGVYPSPGVAAHSDGNEVTAPVTANVWAEHAVWPQDPGFQTALEGGVTTLQILPGSANLVGGRGVTLKNVPAASYKAMKFPDAKHGLKMACGENPKRVYGSKAQAPSTRMGNVAGYRQAFADAQEYKRSWQKYERELAAYDKKKTTDKDAEPPSEPKRDLKLETLSDAMDGKIIVHIHCYRADEMQVMLDLAEEFGFKVAAFHHGVEAYKIANRLAEKQVCGALWADWWGFKMESFDGIPENLAMVDRPDGGCSIVHSDSEEGVQRLNQEAAKGMTRGNAAGMQIDQARAIRWITSNAAKALGIADRTGSLEAGKMADVVIWNRDPFSVYALAEQVFIDGVLMFDRAQAKPPRSDFMLGQPGGSAP